MQLHSKSWISFSLHAVLKGFIVPSHHSTMCLSKMSVFSIVIAFTFDNSSMLSNEVMLVLSRILSCTPCYHFAAQGRHQNMQMLCLELWSASIKWNPNFSMLVCQIFFFEANEMQRNAWLMNWLANIMGCEDSFKEMDLLQEHQNFWDKVQ